MLKTVLRIKRWGNSLGVRLPMSVAREAHFHIDQQVSIGVEDGHVVISALPDTPLTLEQRLERFNPARHGGEVMVTHDLGAERW